MYFLLSFLEFLSELPNGDNTNTVTLVNNTNTNTNQCGICYDTTNLLATPCSHFFCKPCLIAQHNSRNRKCALCRTFLPVEFRNTYTVVNLDEEKALDNDEISDYSEDEDFTKDEDEDDDDNLQLTSPHESQSEYTFGNWHVDLKYIADHSRRYDCTFYRNSQGHYIFEVFSFTLEMYQRELELGGEPRIQYIVELSDYEVNEKYVWYVNNTHEQKNDIKVVESYELDTFHQIKLDINHGLLSCTKRLPIVTSTNQTQLLIRQLIPSPQNTVNTCCIVIVYFFFKLNNESKNIDKIQEIYNYCTMNSLLTISFDGIS